MRPLLHFLLFCCAVISVSHASPWPLDVASDAQQDQCICRPRTKRGGAEIVGIAHSEDDKDGNSAPHKRLVAYIDFEKFSGTTVEDESGFENNAKMDTGVLIAKIPDSNCGNVAYLWCVDIRFQGAEFQAKPKVAVTVAAWVYLVKLDGQHSVFHTVGNSHAMGQFHFEVNWGIVRWFHRNEQQQVVFETMAHEVKPHEWTHIAGTYNATTKQAKVYINGVIKNATIGCGCLSRDWAREAKIGNEEMKRPLSGLIDEFRIYNYALTADEIKALYEKCKFGQGDDSTLANQGAGRTIEKPLKELPWNQQKANNLNNKNSQRSETNSEPAGGEGSPGITAIAGADSSQADSTPQDNGGGGGGAEASKPAKEQPAEKQDQVPDNSNSNNNADTVLKKSSINT